MSLGGIFKTILKDVGIGFQIFMGIEPLVYNTLPQGARGTISQVTDDLTQIAQAVASAQAVVTTVTTPGATPEQVIAAAAPLVAGVIHTSEIAAGKKITNPALYAQAINELSAGVVHLLASIDK